MKRKLLMSGRQLQKQFFFKGEMNGSGSADFYHLPGL
jgi:hypothetical protein